jgi:predicted RNA-binding Zn-ribbon protein involved in translation (DUF1610 family)
MAAGGSMSHPSPPYSAPLQEVAPPQADGVRVRFACPYCGEVLERVARLDETRWYLSGCGFGHSGIGIADPSVRRVKARER